MSAAVTSKLSRAAYVKAMQTLSQETTPAKVDCTGSGVWWPFLTHLAFLVKSILTSKTRWPLDLDQPGCAFLSEGRISNATATFAISLSMAFCQYLFWFFLSISIASFMVRGTSTPYLWVVCLIRLLIEDMIAFLFRKTYCTHHTNAASSCKFRATANSTTSTGLDSFRIRNGTHCSRPSTHLTRKFHPTVVLRWRCCPDLIVMRDCSFGIACGNLS
mmetsp:Transcript_10819/g.15257  ORF Transcript_10819/g.15257 Transcript_10819/m.15257 type:complete len:217 (-) Transcript_10819:3115-3765(-)